MEEKDALNYLLDHGMSFEEIQRYIQQDITLEELRQAVESREARGQPIEGAGPAGEGEPRPDFTLSDFKTGRVFEWLARQNGYRQALEEPELADLAKDLGFKAFAKCLREYRKLLKQTSLKVLREDGVSDFAEQNIELNVGEWTADETGIWRCGNGGSVIYACTHPIMPIQRLVSVDTGTTKVRLAYRRSFRNKRPWSEIVVPMSRIAKAADIVALADCGISVTSGERAQALVDFLRDCIDRNQDAIPEVKAVSRMGWNEEGFAPYVGGAAFDSADSFRPVYRAISEHGDFGQWMEEAKDARTYSLMAKKRRRTMTRYIDRKEAILVHLDSPISSNGLISSRDALKRLADIPVADVSPVVHGRWEVSDTPCERFKCSECGGGCWYYDYQRYVAKSRYCPSCGAKMDKEASNGLADS